MMMVVRRKIVSSINSEFSLPKVVYNMSADSSGNIVELSHPLVQDKYGNIFKYPSEDYTGITIDVVSKLKSVGVQAYNIEDNKLQAYKEGVILEVELVDGFTNVNNISRQIFFLLREIRKEQEEVVEKTVKYLVERNKQWGIGYE